MQLKFHHLFFALALVVSGCGGDSGSTAVDSSDSVGSTTTLIRAPGRPNYEIPTVNDVRTLSDDSPLPILVESYEMDEILTQWSANYSYGINNHKEQHALIGIADHDSPPADFAKELLWRVNGANVMYGTRAYSVGLRPAEGYPLSSVPAGAEEFEAVVLFDFPAEYHSVRTTGDEPPVPTRTHLAEVWFRKTAVATPDGAVHEVWALVNYGWLQEDAE